MSFKFKCKFLELSMDLQTELAAEEQWLEEQLNIENNLEETGSF
jgi:recombinational DNA repair protein RecT